MPPLNPNDGPRRSLESSQLSDREKSQIIENPFRTGFSYADSFSYTKDGSTEYVNPRFCRPFPPLSSNGNMSIFTKTEQKLASFSKGSYFLSFLCVSLLIFSSFLYYFPNCDDSILKKEENKFLIEKQKEIQNQEIFSINYKKINKILLQVYLFNQLLLLFCLKVNKYFD
uniref:Uncharacterized protein n=1 Tax=Meloidogyne enterolobii TaxID=390850 RepID=A0A6V7WBC9_MELEN|nr:unnamed protein product [Meloidogyne enterolobii]